MARFVPIVRTFAPIMAGIGSMNYRTFITYNVIGGTLWAAGFLLISYFIGTRIPGIEHYLEYIVIGIIAISLIPVGIELIRNRKKNSV
jgi:membrane-associated protein